ncbi:hypothetical protein GCM10022384_16860 [Streptomyces marokkonensis]|uniref:Uncharacterized protein n=1 Tax=Streptomyces marokkonensis TaxID=324855 RepID=A0ABP7PHN6_9ACTN
MASSSGLDDYAPDPRATGGPVPLVLGATQRFGRLPTLAGFLITWAVAAGVGKSIDWGLPSINSIAVAFVLYLAAARLGLVRGVGTAPTRRAGP